MMLITGPQLPSDRLKIKLLALWKALGQKQIAWLPRAMSLMSAQFLKVMPNRSVWSLNRKWFAAQMKKRIASSIVLTLSPTDCALSAMNLWILSSASLKNHSPESCALSTPTEQHFAVAPAHRDIVLPVVVTLPTSASSNFRECTIGGSSRTEA